VVTGDIYGKQPLRYVLRYIPTLGITFSADLAGQKPFDVR